MKTPPFIWKRTSFVWSLDPVVILIRLGDNKENVALLSMNLHFPLQLQQAVAPLHGLVVIKEENPDHQG